MLVGKPAQLLILAGAVNGLILPVALAIVLVAAATPRLMRGYRHPRWMLAAGWVVVAVMGVLSLPVLLEQVSGLLR